MSRLKKLNKLNKTKTLSVAMSVGLVAANLVNAVPVMAVAPVSAHAMSTKTTIDPAKAQSFDKKDPQEISATVTVSNEEYQLQAVKNGSKTLEEGQDYTFDGSVITISPDYLMNQKVGTVSLKLDFDKGTDPVMRISVKDSRATAKLSTKTVDAKHLKDITATLTLNGDTFAGIEGLQEDSDYTVKGSRVTISKDYLATLADGPNTLVFNFDESPAVELTFTVKNSEAASIKSVEDVNVTTTVGTAPELPATVTATMSDGTTKEVAVQWGTVDVSNPGTVTVAGDVAGTTIKAKATVTVNALVVVQSVAAVDGINVNNGTTAADVIKTLPATVNVTMSDNTTVAANVTWAAPDSYSATTAGAYTFTGTLSGVNNPDTKTASVVVTVLAADSTAPTITPSSTTVNVTAASQAFTFTVADNANGTGVDPDSITVKQGTTALTATAVTGQANTYQVSLNEVKGANQTLTIDAKDKSGNAAATASVALVDKVKPVITNVQALDNKTIVVSFSEPVATTAVTAMNGKYSIYNKANGATNNLVTGAPAATEVQAQAAFANSDKTQIKIILTGTVGASVVGYPQGGLANGGYIFYATAVDDTATVANTIIASSPYEFTGTLTPSSTGPVLVSSAFNSTSGLVTLTFDKNTTGVAPADDKVYFQVGTNKVNLKNGVDYTGIAAGSTLTFTVNATTLANINALGANPQIGLADGAFTDGTNATVAAVSTPTLVAGPILTSVTYDENTNTAHFIFSKTINVSAITTFVGAKFNIGGVDIQDAGLVFNNTSNSTDLSFKLSDAKAQAVEAAVRGGVLTASVAAGEVKDTDATPNANAAATSSVTLVVGTTYVKDTTPPTLTGMTLNSDTGVVALTFNESVKNLIGDFTGASVKFYKDDNTVAGLQTAAANGVVADTLLTTFAGAGVVQGEMVTDATGVTPAVASSEKTTIYINNAALAAALAAVPANTDIYADILAGGVKDANTNVTTADQSVKATKVAVSNATAITAATTVVGTTLGQVTVSFMNASGAVAMDPATATNIANYNLYLTANPLAKPTISSISMNANNTVATLLLSSPLIAATNYSLKTTGIKTATGAAGDIDGTTIPAKAFNSVAGADTVVLSAAQALTLTDKDSNGSVSTGDTIAITFNEPVVLPANLAITDMTVDHAHGLGNSTFALSADKKTLTFTVGSSASIAVGDKITFPTTIKDYEGNALAGAVQSNALTVAGNVAPTIQSAVYTDTNADGAVDAGDTLVVTFTQNVTAATGSVLTDDIVVAGATFTAATLGTNSLTLTIGTPGTIAVGVNADVSGVPANVNITNSWLTPAATGVKAITGTDIIAPTVSGISYKASLHALTFTLSEAVNLVTNTNVNDLAAALAGKLTVSAGSSIGTAAAATAATLSADKKSVTITLDATETLDQYTTVSIGAGTFGTATKNIEDASGNIAVRGQGTAYTLTITQ